MDYKGKNFCLSGFDSNEEESLKRIIEKMGGVLRSSAVKELDFLIYHPQFGIGTKKLRGEWDDYGRPSVMSLDEFAIEFKRVQCGELRPFQLMKQLGMSKTTFYRYVSKIKKNK